jgi:hypothetical protein
MCQVWGQWNILQNLQQGRVWWYIPIILAFGRLRHEGRAGGQPGIHREMLSQKKIKTR